MSACQITSEANLYLELLKRVLVNWHYGDVMSREIEPWSLRRRVIKKMLGRFGMQATVPDPIPIEQQTDGEGMHTGSYTLVGLKRLNNVQECIVDVIEKGIPGDLLEAGVWRGGTVIFMRGVLRALGVSDRKVWVADSFKGLPEPNVDKYPQDRSEWLHTCDQLAVSLDDVKKNFERFDLLDDQVEFLEGYFKDTLGTKRIQKLSVLRLDGDMYESTMDTLVPLYPKLSVGGFVIVDDYQRGNCKQAIVDYRNEHGIDDPVREIDWVSAYWQKTC